MKIRIHIQAKENLLNSFIGRYTFLRRKLNMDKNLIINIWQFFAAILCAVLKYQFVQVHIWLLQKCKNYIVMKIRIAIISSNFWLGWDD